MVVVVVAVLVVVLAVLVVVLNVVVVVVVAVVVVGHTLHMNGHRSASFSILLQKSRSNGVTPQLGESSFPCRQWVSTQTFGRFASFLF